MSSKEEMIARVRKSLGGRAGVPETRKETLAGAEAVLPPIPEDQLVEHFEKELQAVAGKSHRAASLKELEAMLLAILPPTIEGPVVLSRNPILDRSGIPQFLEKAGFGVSRWPSGSDVSPSERDALKARTFGATAGITGVDFVLAESGTLALSSETEGSQLASVAPAVHIVLYTRAQVVESLEEVLRGVVQPEGRHGEPGEPGGRSLVLITGPSRTSDIEQVSIKGVHGPTHLHAVLVDFEQES